MNIGILGGSGQVGQHAVVRLLACTNHDILIGSRNQTVLERVRETFGERVRVLRTDIFDPESLGEFCRASDLVINAAGPSALIFDKVAQKALEASAHYVDPSGNAKLFKQTMEKSGLIKEKGLTFVFYAGLSPGISAIYPLFLGEGLFDEVSSLDLFHAGGGKTTFNSAYDFIASMNDGSSEGMMYWHEGQKKKWKAAVKEHHLPSPVGRVEAYPTLSHEYIQVAKRLSATTARAYNAYTGKETLATLFNIQVFNQATTPGQLEESSRKFMEAVNRDMEGRDPCFMLHVKMDGRKDGKRRKIISAMRVDDTYQMIGKVLAHCAEKILAGSGHGPGCFLLHDAVDTAGVMELLEETGIVPETCIIEEKTGSTNIEGEI